MRAAVRTRASRLCEWERPVRGKIRASGEGLREMHDALENCGRFLGFLKAPLDVLVDPIVKFVRERGGEIGPSVARQIEQSE